ncbi:neutral and basic amino acid transport protein rBAT isoform X2 [Fopius arisanus]|uniref:alpha-glucosidase n=1 Tax=Fopius arisanus TaxID=64838 RepID=A0A0C9REW8_9HYME|nr:PREDICTED: neutral and basic amino acid transport protein rBAT isoform X2 [Fopius arisanus]
MESGRHDLETNAEVNGTNKTVAATYKSIPDEDSNWQAQRQENTLDMGKPENEEIDDGAKEKMLTDDTKISPKKDASQVIFISENGDAKIDVAPKPPTLSGMGKEELMKYANDPFWIRLRWFLFIGFWLLWVGMLVGAIAIIVLAPKCTAPQAKTWSEKSPIVQLEPKDLEAKDAISLSHLLDQLKSQHISVLSLSNILKSTSPGHVTDFRDVDPKVGMENIKSLIKLAKEKDQRVVLEIDPNHSGIDHPWFNRSQNREEPYTNYYVWASPKIDADNANNSPNNWLSINGRSAWEWSAQRGQYYLHQFDKSQPDLNFNNSLVIEEFNKIFNHWLDLGISGFRLGFTQHLIEDPNLQDERLSSSAADVDEYESLLHVYTKDRVENAQVLRVWRENIINKTNGDGLFALRDDIASDILAVFNENQSLVDLPQSSMFLMHADEGVTAEALQKGVNQWRSHLYNSSKARWPAWDLNGKERALRDRMPSPVADSLILMSVLLPGTPVFKLNDTLSSPARAAFATLSEKRSDEIFLYGDFHTDIVNGTVFVYTRLKSGLPGYLVAYQSSEHPAVIDLSGIPRVPEEVNVLTYSPNYVQGDETIETKLFSKKVPIAPKSTLVLTFVPKKNEK